MSIALNEHQNGRRVGIKNDVFLSRGGNLKRRIRRAGRITDISNACRYLEGARVEDRLWCCVVLINQSHSEAGSWLFCLIRRGRGGARFATLTACQKQQ